MSRESEMVVVQRDAQGKPTVWCDPEIVDLIQALNTNGLRTVASCSGHGHISGFISLADGREILLPRSVEERDLMLSVFTIDINGTPLNEQLPAAAPVAPQDDARDAADAGCSACMRTGESNYLGEGWPEKPIRCEKCGGTGKAAAKPTEPTLTTQGEQS